MAKRICRSCGEIIEKTESSWVHRYNRPMSLVIPCRKIDPSPEGLEEICINLVTEA